MSTSKRHKISSTHCNLRSGKCIQNATTYPNRTLDTLPPEVLEMIQRLFSLHEVASTIRLVSRRFFMVATTLLNSTFLSIGLRLENAMNSIEAKIASAKTDIELVSYITLINSLELVKGQYNMLRAVTWRYTHPPRKDKFSRLCFYAGSLLDELNELIAPADRPHSLSALCNPDTNVTNFIAHCKLFMNFFERVSERKLNRSPFISGCKAVDVLDCLAEGRQVLSFRVSSRKDGVVSMRLKYVMKRAWFTCLQVPPEEENCWRDEQRFMYLRLRRLVGSINEHLFEEMRYDRALLLQMWLIPHPRPPPASTYSGYGEYAGQFFYYGNMNKDAYHRKFKVIVPAHSRTVRGQNTNRNYANEMNEFDERDRNVDNEENLRETKENPEVTYLNLVANVELRCSPELAPLSVRAALNLDNYEVSNYSNCPQEFFLRLHFNCPASVANRLPGNFTWELKSPDRRRRNC